MAAAFLEKDESRTEVNHIDGRKENNCMYNLEWVNRRENTIHKYYVLGHRIKRVKAVNRNTGEVRVYASTRAAGHDGFDQSHVAAVCRGKEAHHKDWSFTYTHG